MDIEIRSLAEWQYRVDEFPKESSSLILQGSYKDWLRENPQGYMCCSQIHAPEDPCIN